MVDRCIPSALKSAFKLTILHLYDLFRGREMPFLLIVISLAYDEVLGPVLLQACGIVLLSRSLFRTVCPVIRLLLGIFLDAHAALRKHFLGCGGLIYRIPQEL